MILNKTLGLVCLDTIWYDKTIFAINKTLECAEIDKIFWFSDIPLNYDFNVDVVWTKIPKLEKETFLYNNGLIYTKLMPSIVDTDFAMYIHSDGFAVNKNSWDNRFLEYDYIGAPWPFHNEKYNVGNGGFCLKSKKLHEAILKLDILEDLYYDYPEDNIICRLYRKKLEEEFGINFAPEELACKFSMECFFDYPKQDYNYWVGKSFGFHNINVCEFYGYNFKDLKG
jgi:hypothetical protein